jgi:predicted transcriptional regulator
MTLKQVVGALHLTVRSGGDHLDQVVTGGYVGDLLSDVIANSKAGNIWITMQAHSNIVAVAVLRDIAGIVIVQGRQPAEDTLKRANEENVPILVSDLPAFETAGTLSALLAGSP